MPVILVWCKNNKKVSFCGFVQKDSRNNVSLTLRELAERRQLAYDLIIVLSLFAFYTCLLSNQIYNDAGSDRRCLHDKTCEKET